MNYDYKIDINNKNNAHTMCLNYIEPNSKVLDVGCAIGALGEYLVKEKKCEVIGIDILQEFLTICEQKKIYKKLIQLNLDYITNELDEYKNSFDYILMADVIEHTYNPQFVLTTLKSLLKPDGKLILSIPNIAHASIRLNLLKGKFKYTDMGLLDKTHIRFFTEESIIDLLNSLNLNIDESNFVMADLSTYYEPIDFGIYKKSILKEVAKDPYSYVYQFVLKVSLSNNVQNSGKLKPDKFYYKELKKIKIRELFKYMERKPLFLFKKQFYEKCKELI